MVKKIKERKNHGGKGSFVRETAKRADAAMEARDKALDRELHDDGIPDWLDFDGELEGFDDDVSRYFRLGEEIKDLEKERAELKPALEGGLLAVGAKSVRVDEFVVTRVVQERSTIVAEKLLSQGVTMDVIKKATRTTESSYPLVRKLQKGAL